MLISWQKILGSKRLSLHDVENLSAGILFEGRFGHHPAAVDFWFTTIAFRPPLISGSRM
jgi:hypothetical protein